MRVLFLLIVMLIGCASGAVVLTQPENPLHGEWQYYKYIYRGKIQFPRDKDTKLNYIFDENGRSTLVWKNEVDKVYCERRGLYFVNGDIIKDEVVWVNPKNTLGCGSDPDMRIGNRSYTKYRIQNGELELDLPLADEFLTYVFKKSE